jgi:cyclophilin family peptidyl-prolyl cis-trans isomerase
LTQTAVITLENRNELRLEFYPADAPKIVENFVTLASTASTPSSARS